MRNAPDHTGLDPRRRFAKPKTLILLAFAIVSLLYILAVLSRGFTYRSGDFTLPAGEVRFSIVDVSAKPIEGAILHLGGKCVAGAQTATEFEETYHDATSDELGKITITRKRNWVFITEHWRLFWLIDQDDRKRCYYEIGAKGYKPLRFPITQLQVPYWWSRRDLPTTTLEIDGKTQELPVYEYTLVLEKR